MTDQVANFVKVTVLGAYSAPIEGVTLIPGDGLKLPEIPGEGYEYNMVYYDSTNYPNPADDPNVEIMRVLGVEEDNVILSPGQEGTTPTDKGTPGATYLMILAPTAKIVTDLQIPPGENGQLIFNSEGAYGTDEGLTFGEGTLTASTVSSMAGVMLMNDGRLRLPGCSGDPGDAVPGDMYYNAVTSRLMVFIGESWMAVVTEEPEP